jgi:cytochrome c oxidase cbb3-type subunit 4
MTFEQASHLAQTAGLVMLAMCFGLAVIYALWPGNKKKFEQAARSPLEDGDDNG